MVTGIPGFEAMTQSQKVEAISKPVACVAKMAADIGCTIGLYNHGDWFGEPENQLAIIDYLHLPNIGMVYNFSHAETQIQHFNAYYPKILPHLLAINITGIKTGNPATVVPVGQGDMETGLLKRIRASDYHGPIGIINESFADDAAVGLKMNITGLRRVLKTLGDRKALKTY